MKKLPTITRKKMLQLDQRMISDFKISLRAMLENAGSALAALVTTEYTKSGKVLVLAGRGNNGAGGLVAARYLHNAGREVDVVLTQPITKMKKEPKKQLETLGEMGETIVMAQKLDDEHLVQLIGEADIIIDALIGYSIQGSVRGEAARVAHLVNELQKTVVALDLPTGIHPDTGKPLGEAIRASATLSLVLPKKGCTKPAAKPYVGTLYVGDISVPVEWYEEQGITELFQGDPYVKVGYNGELTQ